MEPFYHVCCYGPLSRQMAVAPSVFPVSPRPPWHWWKCEDSHQALCQHRRWHMGESSSESSLLDWVSKCSHPWPEVLCCPPPGQWAHLWVRQFLAQDPPSSTLTQGFDSKISCACAQAGLRLPSHQEGTAFHTQSFFWISSAFDPCQKSCSNSPVPFCDLQRPHVFAPQQRCPHSIPAALWFVCNGARGPRVPEQAAHWSHDAIFRSWCTKRMPSTMGENAPGTTQRWFISCCEGVSNHWSLEAGLYAWIPYWRVFLPCRLVFILCCLGRHWSRSQQW